MKQISEKAKKRIQVGLGVVLGFLAGDYSGAQILDVVFEALASLGGG